MNVIGFDIGGTKCAVFLCRVETDSIEWKKRIEVSTTSDWREILNQLCHHAQNMLEEFKIVYETCRIGISCGGPLSADQKQICSPPNLPGWDKVPIVKILSERFNMPASMLNDADACALAEWKYGAGKGTEHMIFLTFGTGLGAGLILNGRLYTGANGGAGEAGHLRMTQEGPIGYGKAGSLEGYCSGGGIAKQGISYAEKAQEQGRYVSFQNGSIDEISARDIANAAYSGYEDAKAIYAKSGAYFGKGLAILMDLFNPQAIVVGSIYARSHTLLEESMWEEIRKEALPANVSACKVVPAQLGEQIGDYGAVMAAIYE